MHYVCLYTYKCIHEDHNVYIVYLDMITLNSVFNGHPRLESFDFEQALELPPARNSDEHSFGPVTGATPGGTGAARVAGSRVYRDPRGHIVVNQHKLQKLWFIASSCLLGSWAPGGRVEGGRHEGKQKAHV